MDIMITGGHARDGVDCNRIVSFARGLCGLKYLFTLIFLYFLHCWWTFPGLDIRSLPPFLSNHRILLLLPFAIYRKLTGFVAAVISSLRETDFHIHCLKTLMHVLGLRLLRND